MKSKDYWIEKLQMEPHPEGGYYKELAPSNEWLEKANRPMYTTIYFLLTENNPSHFHQLTSNEIWYFHYGSSLTVHELLSHGEYKKTSVGFNLDEGDVLQYTVEKGSIFGSSVETGYALVSCMVSPGFSFEDFKLFTKNELLESHPTHKEIINQLAYDQL